MKVRASWLWMGLGLGCGPVVDQDGSTTGTTDPGAGTSMSSTSSPGTTSPSTTSPSTTSPTTTSTTSSDESTTTGDTDGVIFIEVPDSGGHEGPWCDVWAQDCPEGEKCMPWANDGGMQWNATRCSPVDEGAGMPGDPCTVEGSAVSGIDDCELASMCWNVDPETNTGNCVAFCSGGEANPMCAGACEECVIANDGVLILCLPLCDPRAPDCADDERCLAFGSGFHCIYLDEPGDVGLGMPCESTDQCAVGLDCMFAAAVPGCQGGTGCCTPWCTLGDDAPCEAALPGSVCTMALVEPPKGCSAVAELGHCTYP